MLGQTTKEIIALSRMRSLVGNTPDNHVGTIMVASNHICELLLGILESLRISPCDSPITRNLTPHHNAHTFSFANHILIVWIMSQTNKVASQLLSPSKQSASILNRISTTTTICFLFVYRNSLQEYWLAIKQNLLVASLDSTEAYLVCKG